MLQPQVSHFAQWEGCGQQENIESSPLEHGFLGVREVVRAAVALRADHLHRDLQESPTDAWL